MDAFIFKNCTICAVNFPAKAFDEHLKTVHNKEEKDVAPAASRKRKSGPSSRTGRNAKKVKVDPTVDQDEDVENNAAETPNEDSEETNEEILPKNRKTGPAAKTVKRAGPATRTGRKNIADGETAKKDKIVPAQENKKEDSIKDAQKQMEEEIQSMLDFDIFNKQVDKVTKARKLKTVIHKKTRKSNIVKTKKNGNDDSDSESEDETPVIEPTETFIPMQRETNDNDEETNDNDDWDDSDNEPPLNPHLPPSDDEVSFSTSFSTMEDIFLNPQPGPSGISKMSKKPNSSGGSKPANKNKGNSMSDPLNMNGETDDWEAVFGAKQVPETKKPKRTAAKAKPTVKSKPSEAPKSKPAVAPSSSLTVDESGRKVSNNMADACRTYCKLCDDGTSVTLTGMRSHTKSKHNVPISDYKAKFGIDYEIIEEIYHKCGICEKVYLLDNDKVAVHLKSQEHKSKDPNPTTHKNYNEKYMALPSKGNTKTKSKPKKEVKQQDPAKKAFLYGLAGNEGVSEELEGFD